MARKPRLEYPGGIYHVIQRGNNREFIFQDNAYKELLLELLEHYQSRFEFDLFGYVIMGNHYHLIIRQSQISLQNIMHRTLSVFARQYNRLNRRSGHVFEGRYKAIPVMDDKYLLSLLRYLHQNPVAANICKKTSDYAWSSDRLYRTNNKENSFVNIDYILDIISSNRPAALKIYVDFMDDKVKEAIAAFEEVDFIGEKELQILDAYLEAERQSLDEILWEKTQERRLFKEIKAASRKRHLTPYKKHFIRAASRAGYSMQEIGKHISISASAVFYLMYDEKETCPPADRQNKDQSSKISHSTGSPLTQARGGNQ